jgi:hypothetical protein
VRYEKSLRLFDVPNLIRDEGERSLLQKIGLDASAGSPGL